MKLLALGGWIDFHRTMVWLRLFLLLSVLTLARTQADADSGVTSPTAAPAVSPLPASPASLPSTSFKDPFCDPLIKEVQARHQLGVEGNKKAVTDLIADLERWTQEHPENVLLKAYLGSAYTLLSRDLFPGPQKLRYLKLGLLTMDQAVAAAPQDVGVRFVRAVNNFSMPAFVNRRETARNDFAILVQEVRTPEVQAGLNVETAQAIYYYAGLSYKQLHQGGDARDAWLEGRALGVATPLGVKMNAELGRLKI